MIATSHLIIGGSVGVATAAIIGAGDNPALIPVAALATGIASHLLGDSIPHWDHPDAPRVNGEMIWTKAVWIFAYSDSIFGGLIVLSIWGIHYDFNLLSPFLWGAAGGYLPDFLDNVPFWKNKLRRLKFFQRFHTFHEWIHQNWEWRFPMPKYWLLGTITQLLIVVPCLWYLLH